MVLVLFALFMVLPWALSDKVSTKPGLKFFRDEYKSVAEACLDIGFAKKEFKSGSYTGIFNHLAEDFLSFEYCHYQVYISRCVFFVIFFRYIYIYIRYILNHIRHEEIITSRY